MRKEKVISKKSYAFKVLKLLGRLVLEFFDEGFDAILEVGESYVDRRYLADPLQREEYLRWKRQKPYKTRKKISDAVEYLKKKEYLRYTKTGLYFSKDAIELLYADELEEQVYKKEKKTWDGKWRLLFFDIPERQRLKRALLRSTLKRLGFSKCQQSVWMCRYDVARELKEISKVFGLDDFIILVETKDVILGGKYIK